MVLTPEPRDVELASMVGRAVRLDAVYLVDARATNRFRGRDIPADTTFQTSFTIIEGRHRLGEKGPLVVEAGVRVEFRAPRGETAAAGEPDGVIEVVYGVEYTLPPGPVPAAIGEEGLRAFARLNGVFNSWPYIRQEVDRLGSSMGVPFLLPLLRIETKRPAPPTAGAPVKEEVPAEKKGRRVKK